MSRHGGVYLVVRDACRIGEAKKRATTTFNQLALATGCSKGFLCELALGTATRIDAHRAARIEDALGVSRGALFVLDRADSALLSDYMPLPRGATA
jgi:hypothetical protein